VELASLPELTQMARLDFEQAGVREITSDLEPFRWIFNRLGERRSHQASRCDFDEVLEKELALDERLDAIADRAIKRLIQIKAAKQALGLARPVPAVVDQPTKNVAARISERVKRSARRPSNREA